MTRWVAVFSLLCGAYFLFVGPFSRSETLAALPAVLGGFALAILSHRMAERPIRLRLPWRVIAGIPLTLMKDSFLVGRALLLPVSGSIALQRFDPGGADENAAGRRAAVILGASLPPNGYVIQVTDDALLMHRLAPAPENADLAWPL